MPGATPPIFPFVRSGGPSPLPTGPNTLVAARVRDRSPDRIELSPAAGAVSGSQADGTLSPFRTAADRVEAATGVARGRLVDRRA